MCANFKKAFKKENISVPDSILKQLGKILPDGFQYKSLNDGACVVVPDDINKIIKKESFIIPEHLLDKDIDEILKYTYSSQEPLKFKKSIPVEGKVLKVEDMIKFPFRAKEISFGEVALLPSPFKEFNIELEAYGVKKTITMKREVSKNIEKITFKRVDFNDLEFLYTFDLNNLKINFNMNINFENCNSIETLLEYLKLYKAFAEGILKLDNINLSDNNYKFKSNINKQVIDDMIDFYDKLLKITKLINIEIKPKESIDTEDICSVEELYKSLIEKKPCKEYIDIDKLNIGSDKDLDNEFFSKNDAIAFQASCDCEWTVLGSEIVLPSVMVIYNIIVTDIRKIDSIDGINYELDITNTKGKKIYKSSMYFKNKEEHDDYINNVDNVIESLKDSEEINI